MRLPVGASTAVAKEHDGTSACGGIKEQVNFCRLLLLQKLTYPKKIMLLAKAPKS
jgi:hypothetical protein